MFADMGEIESEAIGDALLNASSTALEESLADGSYVGWLAYDETGAVIGGVGVHIKAQLPRVTRQGHVATGPVPLVVNVYTLPAWRGRGVARALMATLMDWSRTQNMDRVVLHASVAGRPLYEALGFKPTNEMRWNP